MDVPWVRRLFLQNIKCFGTSEISFLASDSAVSAAVVLGDNGTGKTTLLRALALGLCDPKDAKFLFETQDWLRKDATNGTISVEMLVNGEVKTRDIHIVRREYGEDIDHISDIANTTTTQDNIFVCAYGAARRTFGTESPRSYRARDAVSTLFTRDAPLQNPELAFRRIADSGGDREDLLQRINRLLMLPQGSTKLGDEGFEVRGPWGEYTPVGSLSDGYNGTLAWILDMIGRAFMHSPSCAERGVRGVVLVDELEQHLHPSWQRRIISRLHEQFPLVQFVFTTHAPLCVVGTTDLDDHDVALTHLGLRGGVVKADSGIRPPRGMRADNILTSYLFGLDTTGDDETAGQIRKLSVLLGQGELNEAERGEVERLRHDLELKLSPAETDLERDVSAELLSTIEDGVRGRLIKLGRKLGSGSAEPIDFEIRRQLRDLFEHLP